MRKVYGRKSSGEVGNKQGEKKRGDGVTLWGTQRSSKGLGECVSASNAKGECRVKIIKEDAEIGWKAKKLEFLKQKGPVNSVKSFGVVDKASVSAFFVTKARRRNFVQNRGSR